MTDGWDDRKHHGSFEMWSRPETVVDLQPDSMILRTKQSPIKRGTCICHIRVLLAQSHAPNPGLPAPSYCHGSVSTLHSSTLQTKSPGPQPLNRRPKSIALHVQTLGSPQPPPDAISQHTSILIILSHLPPRQENWDEGRITAPRVT